jgi:hypothetical protein
VEERGSYKKDSGKGRGARKSEMKRELGKSTNDNDGRGTDGEREKVMVQKRRWLSGESGRGRE